MNNQHRLVSGLMKKVKNMGTKLNNSQVLVGKGLNSEIFQIAPNVVVKITPKPHPAEFRLHKKAGNARIAPKILTGLYKSGNFYGYAMEKLPPNTISLKAYLTKFKRANLVKPHLLNALTKLRNLQILHGNLHNNNIMVTINPKTGEIIKLWIIDFGRSYNLPPGMNSSHVFNLLRNLHLLNNQDTFNNLSWLPRLKVNEKTFRGPSKRKRFPSSPVQSNNKSYGGSQIKNTNNNNVSSKLPKSTLRSNSGLPPKKRIIR